MHHQRNLADAGRDQTAVIDQELRALKIPFGQVYASPYCRAMQFSNFLFGRARPEPGMQLPDPLPMEARQQNTADFEKLLETAMPIPGRTPRS